MSFNYGGVRFELGEGENPPLRGFRPQQSRPQRRPRQRALRRRSRRHMQRRYSRHMRRGSRTHLLAGLGRQRISADRIEVRPRIIAHGDRFSRNLNQIDHSLEGLTIDEVIGSMTNVRIRITGTLRQDANVLRGSHSHQALSAHHRHRHRIIERNQQRLMAAIAQHRRHDLRRSSSAAATMATARVGSGAGAAAAAGAGAGPAAEAQPAEGPRAEGGEAVGGAELGFSLQQRSQFEQQLQQQRMLIERQIERLEQQLAQADREDEEEEQRNSARSHNAAEGGVDEAMDIERSQPQDRAERFDECDH